MANVRVWGLAVGIALLLAAALAVGCGPGEDIAKGESAENTLMVEGVEQDALQKYKWYLESRAILLADQVGQLKDDIARGDDSAAKLTYIDARVAYGHVLPSTELFGSLTTQIDGQPSGPLAGFRGLARPLFRGEGTAGLGSAANRLVANVMHLQDAIEVAETQPLEIARANGRLMDAISTRMIDGREETDSGIGLVDASASLEGAERAVEALRPLLASSNPDLVLRIEAQFVEAYERLAEHGGPAREFRAGETTTGTIFVPYADLSPSEIREIGTPLRALAALFSEIPSQLPQS